MNLGNNPTRSSAAKALVSAEIIALRTMTVGRVLRVYSNGWVDVDPQVQMVKRNPQTRVEVAEDIGRLQRVPIGMFKAGGFIMTLPVSPGDEGILLFSDRSLDMWKSTGRKAPPRDTRFHDVSDGVFIPFPTSHAGSIAGFDIGGAFLGLEDRSIGLHLSSGGQATLKASQFTVDCPDTVFTGTVRADALRTDAGFDADAHIHANGTRPDGTTGTFIP